MNQRNQELIRLERGAFSSHIVAALFPCPELLLPGKESAEGRQEGYPLITDPVHCSAGGGICHIWLCLT